MRKDIELVTFGFIERTQQVIKDLKNHFGLTHRAEVIQKALALLELLKDVENDGNKLIIVDKEFRKIQQITIRPSDSLEEWVILDWKQMQPTDNLPRFTPAMESSLILSDQNRILIRRLTRNKAEKLAEELSLS